jgi:hypothetical protein
VALDAARKTLRPGRAAFLVGTAVCLVTIPLVDFNEPSHPWASIPLWAVVVFLCAARLQTTKRPWLIAALPPILFLLGRYLEVTISARDFALIADEGGPLTPLGSLLRNGWLLAQLGLTAWVAFLRSPRQTAEGG